jgi:hypothetical protein
MPDGGADQMLELKELCSLPVSDERLAELLDVYRDIHKEIALLKTAPIDGVTPVVTFDAGRFQRESGDE